MSMMEKLLNRIRQKIVVDDYDEETLSHDEDADHEKNEDETLSHDGEDDKTQQTQKLYVLHVMIETTTTNKRKKVMLTFENRLSIRYTCSKTTMESENLDKKESI